MAEQLKAKELELYDYEKTKENLDKFFLKYRDYKISQDIIRKRIKCAGACSNLGIFTNSISDQTSAKAEQLIKMQKYIDDTNTIISINISELTKEEKICLKRYIIERCSNDDLENYMNLTHVSVINVKKSCYIKVARWFDKEVRIM